MKRNNVLAGLMAGLMAMSMASCAVKKSEEPVADNSYKVGIVNYVDDASLNQIVSNLEAELDAQGEALGVTFDYEPYYENAQADPGNLTQIGADLVEQDVDVIVAVATPTALTMMTAAEETDIPIIFAAVSDPCGVNLVESMEQPGGKATGTSDALNTEAILDLMFAIDPDLQKVGLLYDTAQDASTAPIADAKAYLDAKGVEYVEKNGSTTDTVAMAAQQLVDDGVEAVFTPTDNTIMTAELSIYETFTKAGIPHYCGADSFALNGAFIGYGVDYALLGRETGKIVADVLVNGKDTATYGVVTFDNGLASINTETCEALGYDLDEMKQIIEPLVTGLIELKTQEEFDK